MAYQTTVIIDFDVEGFHEWIDVPANKRYSFLRNSHRHMFRIRAGIRVEDLNREVEIFDEQWKVIEWLRVRFAPMSAFESNKYPEGVIFFGTRSCEMIAQEILENFEVSGYLWVEVLEDGRGGAKVEVMSQ